MQKEFKDEITFWEKVRAIFGWEWSEKDYNDNNNEIINDSKSSLGLPQGLVASGFFSNAYLIRFDRLVGNCIKKEIKNSNFQILDYCRYVDDIRIVVEATSKTNPEEIKKKTSQFIKDSLNEHLNIINSNSKININESKTCITPFNQLSTEISISAVMNSIQNRISGTPDADTLEQIVGELVGLLRISDVSEADEKKIGNELGLSRIFSPYLDIRDDTLKRFSATRLIKTLRNKKRMTVLNEKVATDDITMKNISAEQMLDHEFETVARKLISSWAGNPSLSLLLKCGLELYPDVKLLHPVLEALELKLFKEDSNNNLLNERKTAEYVISDLLRAGSISFGHNPKIDYPKSINIAEFREEMALFAKKILSNNKAFPWYVKQQAILFLITNGDYGFTIKDEEKNLHRYSLLHDAILYKVPNSVKTTEVIATSIISQQISPNKQKYTSWFVELLGKLNSKKEQSEVIKLLLYNRPDLLKDIISNNKKKGINLNHFASLQIFEYLGHKDDYVIDFSKKGAIPLLKIVYSKNNPFSQENALLLLAQAILSEKNSHGKLQNGCGLSSILVKCEDWEKVQNPNYKNLKIEWEHSTEENTTKLYESPPWVNEKYRWIYTLGTILRACLTGDFDFTAHKYLYRDDVSVYKGIKSTMFTRQFSLINYGKGLVDESVPITPWLREFLYKLLQWPGVNQWEGYINEWKDLKEIHDLQYILNSRLKQQRELYGQLSNTPVYTLPVSKNSKGNDAKLRFAVVQSLLPQVDDFNQKDPTNWSESYRKKHRDHLASLSNLINKQVKSTVAARKSLGGEKDSSSGDYEGIDIIIFPELSIHPDDIEILRGLSDETKAHIFAGMTFSQPSFTSEPINQALWLLRSEAASGREFIHVYQGKKHMTKPEIKMGIQSYRPYQVIIELGGNGDESIKIAGAICYDATDLAIVADLRDISDVFIISAMNKDIQTFDNMIAYLHYHMYQPVILTNTGEFGGSTVQAPFSKNQRTIAHVHGNQQIAISIFEIDPSIFKRKTKLETIPPIKTPPAGYKGR